MTVIQVLERVGSFAEDKDIAAAIRKNEIRPAIERGDSICIDFAGVEGATQSFVHAMLSDIIRTFGADILDKFEFRSCNKTIQSIVGIVTEYSQLDMDE